MKLKINWKKVRKMQRLEKLRNLYRDLLVYLGILETYEACSQCESEDIGERSIGGDESLTICSDCRSVEQGYITLYRKV